MRVEITYDGGDQQTLVIPVQARRKWEATNKRSVTSAAMSGMSGWVDELTHLALVQRHGEERSLDEWIDTVDRLTLVQADVADTVSLFKAYSAEELDTAIGMLTEMKGRRERGEPEPAVPTSGAATSTST